MTFQHAAEYAAHADRAKAREELGRIARRYEAADPATAHFYFLAGLTLSLEPEVAAMLWADDPETERIADLERIADWAAIVGHGKVRDLCREAADALRDSVKLRRETAEAARG